MRRGLVPGILALALAVGTVGSSGCARDATAPGSRPHPAILAADVQAITGEIGPGARYGLYRPANWNGDLVLLAHGYVSSITPPNPPDKYGGAPLKDALVALGYGVAMSSFSYNGFAIKDAMVRTAQLQGLFAENFGSPTHTYLVSSSLGATVAMRLAEQNPRRYSGVMPVCGIVAGVPYQVYYYFNTRVVFDALFGKGILPGDAVTNPNGWDAATGAALQAVLSAHPELATELAGVDQTKMAYSTSAQLFQSITMALTFNAMDAFTNDLLKETHGRPFFDNQATAYHGSSNDGALNANVERFSATPDALNALRNLYSPTGNLQIPMLSLHMRYDPVVPISHEAAYAALVQAHGNPDLLVTRIFEGGGHCGVPLSEQVKGLQDLVNWAENGIKPTP